MAILRGLTAMTDTCEIGLEEVRDVVFEHLELDTSKNDVTPDTLWDSLTTDSLDCVELIMALEERFNTVLPDYVFEGVFTVGEMTAFICSSLS